MRVVMPNTIDGNGATQIGNGTIRIGIGPLRHHRPHGPVRINGSRKNGANMIVMIRNGGIDINPRPGLCALRHQALNRSARGCQRSCSPVHILIGSCK